MEGGEFLLTWTGELIRDLAAEGNVRSAALTIRKLCEVVDVEVQMAAYEGIGRVEQQAWLRLFSETLMDCVGVK